jgi:hypothetical protein
MFATEIPRKKIHVALFLDKGARPHPEASPNQVQMELNAIRWLYAHRTTTKTN